MLLPVIMAGGSGSRLWPMSRELYPKQFLQLNSTDTMLQQTINRLSKLESIEPIVICNQEHRFIVAEQLRQIDKLSQNIILEPTGRNTAPAIALASLYALSKGIDPIMLVLAADHIIDDIDAFYKAINVAIPFASGDCLVTFGIVPTGPETGYGYIQKGNNLNSTVAASVKRFVEKPDIQTAERYIETGEYYWNSGMFMFRAQRYIDELSKFRPDILEVCRQSLDYSYTDNNFINVALDAFSICPNDSIDYAVMEKTKDAIVVPLDAGWSDIGSWSALWDASNKDKNGNVLSGDTFVHESTNCYINTDKKLIAAVGLENIVIINTKDAVLVINKSDVQNVKKVVEYLKENKRSEYRCHRDVYKPWGRCDHLVKEKRFNVNRITVNPGDALSLQMHHHRAEHWVVLAGTAKVTIGNNVFFLTENQSTFIPVTVVHRLENPGTIPLEIIEIQSGSYLQDDDIIRIEDVYGRS